MDILTHLFSRLQPDNTIEYLILVAGLAYIGKGVVALYIDKKEAFATVAEVDSKISKLATNERVDSVNAMCKENRVLINKQIEKTSLLDGEIISLEKDVEHILSEIKGMNHQIIDVIRAQTKQIEGQNTQLTSNTAQMETMVEIMREISRKNTNG